MQSLAARIDSFRTPSPPKSTRTRRAATPKLSWPHPDNYLANPKSLAEAGFYHLPSEEDQDNVVCFMCDKQLSQWEAEDDPQQIHIEKCPTCPWVMVKCRILCGNDGSSSLNLNTPNSHAMDKARLETFGRDKQRWWPHDQVKNHGALSKHMAKAGFVYTPTADPEDDTATCFFCGTILSKWETGDNPLEEHLRRKVASTCPFILSTKSALTSRKGSKATQSTRQGTVDSDHMDTEKKAAKSKRRRKRTEALVVALIEDVKPEEEVTPPKRTTRHQSKSRVATQTKEGIHDHPVIEEETSRLTSQPVSTKPLTHKSKRKKKMPGGPSQAPLEDEVVEVYLEPPANEPNKEVQLERPKTSRAKKRTTRGPRRTKSKARSRDKANVEGEVEVGKTTRRDRGEVETEALSAVEDDECMVSQRSLLGTPGECVIEPELKLLKLDQVQPSSIRESSTPEPSQATPVERTHLPSAHAARQQEKGSFMDAFEREDLTRLEEFFPSLAIPRPLMEGRRIEIPSLTTEERAMTVEGWIRAEMQKQFEALRFDGEKAISRFQQHAREVRQRISTL